METLGSVTSNAVMTTFFLHEQTHTVYKQAMKAVTIKKYILIRVREVMYYIYNIITLLVEKKI